MSSQASLAPTAKRNIAAIAQLEQEVLGQRSLAERMGGAVARFFGSLRFILVQFFFVSAWIVVNGELTQSTAISALADEIEKARERESRG